MSEEKREQQEENKVPPTKDQQTEENLRTIYKDEARRGMLPRSNVLVAALY